MSSGEGGRQKGKQGSGLVVYTNSCIVGYQARRRGSLCCGAAMRGLVSNRRGRRVTACLLVEAKAPTRSGLGRSLRDLVEGASAQGLGACFIAVLESPSVSESNCSCHRKVTGSEGVRRWGGGEEKLKKENFETASFVSSHLRPHFTFKPSWHLLHQSFRSRPLPLRQSLLYILPSPSLNSRNRTSSTSRKGRCRLPRALPRLALVEA